MLALGFLIYVLRQTFFYFFLPKVSTLSLFLLSIFSSAATLYYILFVSQSVNNGMGKCDLLADIYWLDP